MSGERRPSILPGVSRSSGTKTLHRINALTWLTAVSLRLLLLLRQAATPSGPSRMFFSAAPMAWPRHRVQEF